MSRQVLPVFGTPDAARGSDSGADPRHQQADFLFAKNAVYKRSGAIGKRNGFRRSSSAVFDGYRGVFGANGALWGMDANGLGTIYYPNIGGGITPYSGAAFNNAQIFDLEYISGFAIEDAPAPVGVTWDPRQRMVDSCGYDDWLVVAGSVFDGSNYIIKMVSVDKYGNQISSGTAQRTYSDLPFIKCQNFENPVTGVSEAHVYYPDPIAGMVQRIYIDGELDSTNAISGATAYLPEICHFDSCVMGDDVFLIYQKNDATDEIVLVKLANGSASSTTALTITSASFVYACSVWAAGSTVGVAYSEGDGAGTTTLYSTFVDPATMAAITPVSIETWSTGDFVCDHIAGVCIDDGTTNDDASHVIYNKTWRLISGGGYAGLPVSQLNPGYLYRATVSNGGAAAAVDVATAAIARHLILTGKPARVGSTQKYFFGVSYRTSGWTGADLGADYNAILNEAVKPVASCLWGVAMENIPATGTVFARDGGYSWAGIRALSGVLESGRPVTESAVVQHIRSDRGIVLDYYADAVRIAGALPMEVNNGELSESNFLEIPHGLSATIAGSGNLENGSTYRAKVVFEDITEDGDLIQSVPSPIACEITTTGASQSMVVTFQRLSLTRRSAVRAVVYRTLANGTEYYRDVCESMSTIASAAETMSINCVQGDANLARNEILYTDAGIAEHQPPLPHSASCAHDRSHFYVPKINADREVRYSAFFSNTEPVWYSEDYSIPIDASGGPVTALASHMGRLLAFKSSRIYQAETLDGFHLAVDGVGAKSQKTVLSTPGGVFFQSADDRILLVGSDMGAGAIGQPVRYWTDIYGEIVSCCAWPEESLAFFAFDPDSGPIGSNPPVLVYNWLYNKWSIWEFEDNTAFMAVAGSSLYRVCENGYAWKYDSDLWNDYDGSSYYWHPLHIRTGFIDKTGTRGAWKRINKVKIGGYNRSSLGYTITAKLATNGVPYFHSSKNYDAANLAAFGESSAYSINGVPLSYYGMDLELSPDAKHAACESICIDIRDAKSDYDNQQTMEITDISLTVTPKLGPSRVGKYRRF